ncbi:MAG TPA: diphosphomevalonate decarboxylase [Candidatus Bathyarchaeia archaeon]|nr:diphosphomevalonate decarboxylase [Candidatus Bathyarchaeia archaeon]
MGKEYKATVISPATIAFIKYWGWWHKDLVLPNNDSISMTMDKCLTTTTVEFSPNFEKDLVKIKFFGQKEKTAEGSHLEKVLAQVNRIRKMANIHFPVKVVSHNSFPSDAGIAASGSAFSALTVAATAALSLNLSKKELSILTRLAGSGSACRSIIDGFAYWQKGKDSETCYAYQLKDEKWWDLVDIVAVVDTGIKEFSSRTGHQLAAISPYYRARLKELPSRIKRVKQAILSKNFQTSGEAIEEEAISMHIVAMTSRPPIFYWNQGTIEIIQVLRQWRKKGLFAYFTIDAGPNVHVICQKKDYQEVNRRLKKLSQVLFTIINRPCKGTRLAHNHIF